MERLPHGYTNETTRGGEYVTKRYVGSGARERRDVERTCLQGLHERLPVATIVDASAPAALTMSFVQGSHGQALIDRGLAGLVLRLSGELLKDVQRVPIDALEGIPGDGGVLVHGDFGPQNLLIDKGAVRVTALLDWEFAHLGGWVEDLAWAEWIVRMHHPAWGDELEHLFAAYGNRPAWRVRQSEMIRRCEQLVRFAEHQGWPAAAASWRNRVRATERWAE